MMKEYFGARISANQRNCEEPVCKVSSCWLESHLMWREGATILLTCQSVTAWVLTFQSFFNQVSLVWSPSLLTVQSLFNHVSLFQALLVSQTSKCPWQNKETGLAKVGVKLKALQNGRTGNLAELKKFGARTCHIYELYMWKCKLQTAGIACVFHFFQSKCKKENRRNSEWEKISTSPSATKGFWRR